MSTECLDIPVHVTLAVDPRDVVPVQFGAALLQLLVVGSNVLDAIVGDGTARGQSLWGCSGPIVDRNVRQLPVVLDLILEGNNLLNNLLALGELLGIIGLGDGSVEVVNGAGLGERLETIGGNGPWSEAYQDNGPSLANGLMSERVGVRGDGRAWSEGVSGVCLLDEGSLGAAKRWLRGAHGSWYQTPC